MKHIKYFEEKDLYDNYINGDESILPNVSYVGDVNEVFYNPFIDTTFVYEFVDLGLPSGLKWATTNIGATKPEEFGLYFAWGETEGYTGITENKGFYWGDYKFHTNQSDPTSTTFEGVTKYNTDSEKGTVDNLTTLELLDDVAYRSDNTCRMPTSDDFTELLNNTTSVWETLNGVEGRRFTSNTNGNSVFIPAAGFCHDGSVRNVGSNGYCWLSSLYYSPDYGWAFTFYPSNTSPFLYYRSYGLSVRPVKDSN